MQAALDLLQQRNAVLVRPLVALDRPQLGVVRAFVLELLLQLLVLTFAFRA